MLGCLKHRQRLATGGDAWGVCKSRHVGAAFSPGPDQAGAHFLSDLHGDSFGLAELARYGNRLECLA